jgi:hypothetical protein
MRECRDNPVSMQQKHIDVYYHLVRDPTQQGRLDVAYVPAVDIVADGMTKPVQRVALERFKNQLGMLKICGFSPGWWKVGSWHLLYVEA